MQNQAQLTLRKLDNKDLPDNIGFFIEEEDFRKKKLTELFEILEKRELRLCKISPKEKKYDRMFRGSAIVSKIFPAHLHLKEANGKPLGLLASTPAIAPIIRVGEELEIVLGLRGNYWRVVYLSWIETHFTPSQLDY